MKKIVIIGVLDQYQSTNISMAKSFIKKGYEVIPVNYRTIIQRYSERYFQSLVLDIVKNDDTEFVMFCKCNGINSSIIEETNNYTKTVLWMPDVINERMQRYPEVIEHAKIANYSFITSGGVVEYFKNHGGKNCYHILDGNDFDLFRPVDAVNELKADISFIGTKLPHREEYLNMLAAAGYNVKAYGNGFNGEIYNTDFAKVCCSSKYMLSVNTINVKDGVSNRLFRYLGCGSCTLHWDDTETIKNYFVDGKEILLFKDPHELITKLKFYGDKYEEIGKKGMERVKKDYSWDNTIDKILEKIE